MKTNYLVGLNKQLDHAMENGLEEAYVFAENVRVALELIGIDFEEGDDDGDSDDEIPSGEGSEDELDSGDGAAGCAGAQSPDGADDGVQPHRTATSGVASADAPVDTRVRVWRGRMDRTVPGPTTVGDGRVGPQYREVKCK